MSQYHSENKAGFLKYKKKRKVMTVLFLFMFGTLFFAGIVFSILGKNADGKFEDTETVNDFKEYGKGKLSGSLFSAMNNLQKDDLVESKPENLKISQKKTLNKSGGRGKNYEKDSEIVEKYAKIVDAASENYENSTPSGRKYFVPGGKDGPGGVFIKNGKSESDSKVLNIHNVEIKVRLNFSIRSTAASTVVATVIDENGTIPAGSKFYGSATGYVNKRTQISFSKMIVSKETYLVKGFAVSGRDPGIESEVTDISGENVSSSVKQGVVQTVSNVAVKMAGVAGGTGKDAAVNTVNPASSEIQKQQEADKMTTEYRVPAGTSFSIYLE